jgi:hypothetical protein
MHLHHLFADLMASSAGCKFGWDKFRGGVDGLGLPGGDIAYEMAGGK